jgi:hypothetical protein
MHLNENPIYVFPEKELCDLSPNFHIYVSVSDLNIPRIGPHIFLQQNVEIGTERPHDSFSGNIYGIFGIVSLQCVLGVLSKSLSMKTRPFWMINSSEELEITFKCRYPELSTSDIFRFDHWLEIKAGSSFAVLVGFEIKILNFARFYNFDTYPPKKKLLRKSQQFRQYRNKSLN